MIHSKRRFSIKPTTPAEMIETKQYTWCTCNSWSIEHDGQTYLLLNDAFGEDSVVELAICKVLGATATGYTVEQVESLTISWVEDKRVPSAIIKCCECRDFVSAPFDIKCDVYTDHHCYLCA